MTVRAFLRILWAGRYYVLAAVLVALVGAGLYVQRQVAVFEASAVVQIISADTAATGSQPGTTLTVDPDANVRLSEGELGQGIAFEDVARPEPGAWPTYNGNVSGNGRRIVTGCSQDSNCAASTRYMKMSDSASAWRNADAVRLSSRDRPANPRRYSGPSPS